MHCDFTIVFRGCFAWLLPTLFDFQLRMVEEATLMFYGKEPLASKSGSGKATSIRGGTCLPNNFLKQYFQMWGTFLHNPKHIFPHPHQASQHVPHPKYENVLGTQKSDVGRTDLMLA